MARAFNPTLRGRAPRSRASTCGPAPNFPRSRSLEAPPSEVFRIPNPQPLTSGLIMSPPRVSYETPLRSPRVFSETAAFEATPPGESCFSLPKAARPQAEATPPRGPSPSISKPKRPHPLKVLDGTSRDRGGLRKYLGRPPAGCPPRPRPPRAPPPASSEPAPPRAARSRCCSPYPRLCRCSHC